MLARVKDSKQKPSEMKSRERKRNEYKCESVWDRTRESARQVRLRGFLSNRMEQHVATIVQFLDKYESKEDRCDTLNSHIN